MSERDGKRHGRCEGKKRSWRHHPFEIDLPTPAEGSPEVLFDHLAARLEERDIVAGYAELGDDASLGERIDLCQELLESDLLFVAGRRNTEGAFRLDSADDPDKLLGRVDALVSDATPAIRGLVLAGGSSRRMGEDKAAIRYHGVSQLERVVELLTPITDSVSLSVRDEHDTPPEVRRLVEAGSARLLPDCFRGMGPSSGIMSALRSEPDSAWLVVAVDLPYLDRSDLNYLLAHRNPLRFATAFGTPEPEPVCTIYEPKALPRMLAFLAQGISCPRRFLRESRSTIIAPPREATMINANTPDERDAIINALADRAHTVDGGQGGAPGMGTPDEHLIPPAEIDALLSTLTVSGPGSETIPILDAPGRVLAQPVVADRDQPPFERATMDGIAVSHDDVTAGVMSFAISGTLAAGEDPTPFAAAGSSGSPAVSGPATCVEIMTGAPVPSGFDRVIPYEDLEIDPDHTVATLTVDARQLAPGGRWSNVHRAGSDYRAGETLADEGTLVTSPIVSILASCGQSRVEVRMPARIALVSTGTEIVDIAATPTAYQIRGSNAATLHAELRGWGMSDVETAHFADDPVQLESGLSALAVGSDVIIMCGGVSKGKFDFVPDVLKRLRVEVIAHRVAQRPGKPFLIGRRGTTLVFGLPGNPVSSLVCLRRYVVPLLVGSRARPEHVLLGESIDWTLDLTYFPAVTLHSDGQGGVQARPIESNGSGDFHALAPSHGFVEVTSYTCRAGSVVPFYRWAGPAPETAIEMNRGA